MNIENMEKVIAALEAAPDKKFNMGDWIRDNSLPAVIGWETRREALDAWHKSIVEFEQHCGTSACIAGWAFVTLVAPEDRLRDQKSAWWIANKAQDLLGLNDSEAYRLFYGEFSAGKSMPEITRTDAVAEMRCMIEDERAR